MKKKQVLWLSLTAVALLVIIIVASKGKNTTSGANDLFATVKQGPFKVIVSTSGEVEAKNSVKVRGPQKLRQARVYRIKINKLVAEGTQVKKGEFVAELDKSEVVEGLKNEELELEERLLTLDQVLIDTAIDLQKARNNLANLEATMLEKKLEVEKSVYEPPVIIKQAQAEYERAQRQYEQAINEYDLKLTSSISKVQRENMRVLKHRNRVDFYKGIIEELQVVAPEDGMVIYRKEWNGEKITSGSQVSTWDMVVAELPDLSQLISKTFVNEVDIRKVKEGQKVEITFDAFPDKRMTGEVISVANMGSNVHGGKSKVFQVNVLLDGTDADVKPGMTTGNAIITKDVGEAKYLPIEAVFSQGDSLQYVFVQQKFNTIKKEVLTGGKNEQDVIIVQGLNEGDKVRYTPPEEIDNLEIHLLDKNAGISENIE